MSDTPHVHGAGRNTPAPRDAHGGRATPPAQGGNPVSVYIHQVLNELRKVVWPTRNELATYVAVVLIFVISIMAFVFVVDRLFTWLVGLVFGG